MGKVILATELQIGHIVSTAHGAKWKIIGGVKGKFDVLVWDKVLPEQSWLRHIKDEKGKELRKLTFEAIRISDEPDGAPIDVDKDPFAYNKDFDPENPIHFAMWNKHMRPTHITPGKWLFELGRLKLFLQDPSITTESDRSLLMLWWKVSNWLIKQ